MKVKNDVKKVKVMSRNFVRRIAVVSDMHIGSRYAMWPEKTVIGGKEVEEGREKLRKYWNEFLNVCDELEIDTVLMAGDILHGQNVKGRGKMLITTDLNEQVEAAEALLSRLLNGRKSVWVEGSEYHSSTPGHSPEQNLCNKLSEKYDTYWKGVVANLKIAGTDRIINLSHGGSSAVVYRETVMAREIMWGKVGIANKKLPKIDVFVHGHWHWFAYVHEYDVHVVQVPCWVAFEPIQRFIKFYVRFQPDIGGVIIMIDDKSRIVVWHFLYDVPRIADKVEEI